MRLPIRSYHGSMVTRVAIMPRCQPVVIPRIPVRTESQAEIMYKSTVMTAKGSPYIVDLE
jgi:hypothetical protein